MGPGVVAHQVKIFDQGLVAAGHQAGPVIHVVEDGLVLTDHELGRSVDTRLTSAWFGQNRKKKVSALEKAVEFALAT